METKVTTLSPEREQDYRNEYNHYVSEGREMPHFECWLALYTMAPVTVDACDQCRDMADLG